MLAVLISPLYILVLVLLWYRTIKWLAACSSKLDNLLVSIVVGLVYALLAISIPLAFLMPRGEAQRLVALVGNFWLGCIYYAVPILLIAEIIRLIVRAKRGMKKGDVFDRKFFRVSGTIVALLIAGFVSVGIITSAKLHVVEYSVNVDKELAGTESMKIVLIADTHMGYNMSVEKFEGIVKTIKEQDPDMIVWAGDVFDNSFKAVADPEKMSELMASIDCKYKFAVYGNHDIEEKILCGFTFPSKELRTQSREMDEFLDKAGFTILRDEAVSVDGFTVVGRRDPHKPGNKSNSRLSLDEVMKGVDTSKPVFMIDHQPRELQEMCDSGVDIDFSGHTHGGQLFPMTITSSMQWQNHHGMIELQAENGSHKMYSVVTSGAGLYGPVMRVGSQSEIMVVNVKFAK
ncbi:MAG: metallophosphoesterase [Mogibacterium sp.]|nr:metallophosphoesterase [Mogibacterium sp.]